MGWFAVATLLPAALLAAGALLGGVFPGMAVLAITVLVFFLDKLTPVQRAQAPDAEDHGAVLSIGLAAAHLVLLPLVIWAAGRGDHLTSLDKVLLVIGAGLWFGQISNSNAHELIHRPQRPARRLGRFLYASLLNGHHASAHLHVHHVHAATDDDPNSARPGEGFWAFSWRCLRGEYLAGRAAEDRRRKRQRKTRGADLMHPYLWDAGIALGLGAVALSFAGSVGVVAWICVALYANWQLMLSDYVQHYGLRRRILANGKPEPMGPQHSWNAARWYSAAMMLNAPRHSDHHMHPDRPYPVLAHDADIMPTLPQSLPVMAVIALVPPLWRKAMDHRVQRWSPTAEGPTPTRARDVPPAALERARAAGHSPAPLPDWPHETSRDPDQPSVRH